jgi:hypothetical protein
MNQDQAYLRQRISEERRAGMAAASEEARNCHFELAAAYEKRLTQLKRRPTLHIVSDPKVQ